MNCDKALEAISAELDGALSAEEARGLEAQLKTCAECRKLRAELGAIEQGFDTLKMDAPQTLAPSVMRLIRAEKPRKRKPHRSVWFIAAAALLALALGAAGIIELPGFGENRASVSVGDAFSGHSRAEETAERLAQERGCTVLLIRDSGELSALEGAEYETPEPGMRLYTVSADVMNGIMREQTASQMEVYTPKEASGQTDGTACILLIMPS